MKGKGLSKRLAGACLALLIAVSLVAVGCPPVEVEPDVPAPEPLPTFEWRMQAFAPAGHPLVVNSQDFFIDVVYDLSGGRLIIHSYGAGEIVPAMETRSAVSDRTIEMGKWWSVFDAGLDPAHKLFGAVPFGLRHEDWLAWYLRGGGKELKAELYEALNIHIPVVFVEAAGTALQMIQPWATLEDLKGRSVRVVGLQAEIFKRLGIGVIPLPGGEIYTALEAGLIDGAEWAGPILNEALGFHEPAPYMQAPGWHEPGLFTMFIVNKDAWAELPDDLKRIVEIAGLATYAHYKQFTFYENARALERQLAAGAQLIRLPDEDLALLQATAMEVLEEYAAECAFFARVLQSQLDFMELMAPMKAFDDF
ncbi:TRAP transporter substrate-binding protein DctP [Dehalococcoidia bacterium]|nr:TRAP transporter substrate-binding protein DctP [Dehalococcoidia bacterium]